MTDQMEGQDKNRRTIRVAVRAEDLEDVQGHPWKYLAPTDDDTEGQGLRAGFLAPTEEDVEGHRVRFHLEPADDDDTEGHRVRFHLEPADADDTEGHPRLNFSLAPVAPGEDFEAKGYTWIDLEVEDDTEGHTIRGNYLKPEDDVEGQGTANSGSRPPVD